MGLFIYFPVKSVKSSFFASITFQRKFLEQAIAFVEKWALGLKSGSVRRGCSRSRSLWISLCSGRPVVRWLSWKLWLAVVVCVAQGRVLDRWRCGGCVVALPLWCDCLDRGCLNSRCYRWRGGWAVVGWFELVGDRAVANGFDQYVLDRWPARRRFAGFRVAGVVNGFYSCCSWHWGYGTCCLNLDWWKQKDSLSDYSIERKLPLVFHHRLCAWRYVTISHRYKKRVSTLLLWCCPLVSSVVFQLPPLLLLSCPSVGAAGFIEVKLVGVVAVSVGVEAGEVESS